MALPLTLASLSTASCLTGPFKSSKGAFYFFGRDSTTATTLNAFRTTDPTTSWGVFATKTGYTTGITGVRGIQNADVIHIIVADGSGTSFNFKYLTYDMSTDAFVLAETIVSAINSNDSGGFSYGFCRICYRPFDGQPVALFNGAQNAGNASVSYSVRTGVATWSAPVRVDAAAATNYYCMEVLCNQQTSVVHFFWTDLGTNQWTRSLSTANALQTQVAQASLVLNCGIDGIAAPNGLGTTKISLCATLTADPGNAAGSYFDSALVPTWSVSAAINAGSTTQANCHRTFSDGSDVWTLYPKTDFHLYCAKSTDGGHTWGAEQTADGVIALSGAPGGNPPDDSIGLGANTYIRGGNVVIPMIAYNGTAWQYNEFIIRAADVVMGQGAM